MDHDELSEDMHHIEPVKLQLFVFNITSLAREEQVAIKGHLGICPRCRTAAENMRRQRRSIRRSNALARRSTENFTAVDRSCIRLYPHSSEQLINPAIQPVSVAASRRVHTVALFIGRIDELYLRVQQYGETPRYTVQLLTPAMEKYRFCTVYFPQLQVTTELDAEGRSEFTLPSLRSPVYWSELLCLLKACAPEKG